MDDSGAILCQISSLKDMLDEVNEEIDASFQVTREIESEIVKCSEIESNLAARESELTKVAYVTEEGFTKLCLDFQKDIEKEENDVLGALLSEKESLENEIQLLDKKNNALRNSMFAFVEEILEDLHSSNSDLRVEIEGGTWENEKLLDDIDDLKTTLLSTISVDDGHWYSVGSDVVLCGSDIGGAFEIKSFCSRTVSVIRRKCVLYGHCVMWREGRKTSSVRLLDTVVVKAGWPLNCQPRKYAQMEALLTKEQGGDVMV
ncbi:hypothetical protein L1049_027710 [Liquidambar formosana]|uniref:Uncharacterized protein n=1 Tax=Liquidambar formosana TaxID=63359 RepID=A0AAP0RHQ3_LIQFO